MKRTFTLLIFCCSLLPALYCHAEAIHFHNTIAGLRAAGVNKIVIADYHGLDYNMDLAGHVAQGAQLRSAKPCFWREESMDRAQNDRGLAQIARFNKKKLPEHERSDFVVGVAKNICGFDDAVLQREFDRDKNLARLMMTGGLYFEPLNFFHSGLNDWKRFIQAERFGIASVGAGHAFCALSAVSAVHCPPFNISYHLKGAWALDGNPEAQALMYDGFARAAASAPALLAMHSHMIDMMNQFPPESNLSGHTVLDYYLGAHYALLEVPVLQTAGITRAVRTTKGPRDMTLSG